MALIKAKCSSCGGNIKIDNTSKSGVCEHCGVSYITEDIIVNNITNINYTENINGVMLNRSAVLENMLLEYYSDNFNDIDNMKEYAFKVQEYDLNNALARFVIFDNLDSSTAIKNLLSNANLNISFQLFMVMLNICADDINNIKIVNNIVKYQNNIHKSSIMNEILNKYGNKDIKFILNVMHGFKFNKDENTEFLEELYNNSKVSKLSMLLQFKSFAKNNKDFLFNEQKFDEYLKTLKTK